MLILYACYAIDLWPPVGKVVKAVVAGPAGSELLDPLFWPSMFSAMSPFLLLAYFSLSVPILRQFYAETLRTLRMS